MRSVPIWKTTFFNIYYLYMTISFVSKDEIKYEISKVLDRFSDKSLTDLLAFLKDIDNKQRTTFSSDTLQKILSEDKDLLQKLAQ